MFLASFFPNHTTPFPHFRQKIGNLLCMHKKHT
ncbi:MAG: hypothetical protein JWQ57_4871, partial [Mucilaginibacter sp.]|nr:hypothetical protein [Mucilaginibacter sp.]